MMMTTLMHYVRKHQKRHRKPYCCTIPECNKTFGSKSDWKRHENTLHFQLEMWRCRRPTDTSERRPCGEEFYRRELFQHHLRQHHHVSDPEELKSAAQSCRIGAPQPCKLQTWCGFCAQNIPVTSQGLAAWDHRFNHIEKHFKEGKWIDEWIPFNDSGIIIAGSSDQRAPTGGAARNEVSLDEDPRPSRSGSSYGQRREGGHDDSPMRQDRSLPNRVISGPASPPHSAGEEVVQQERRSKKHSRTDDPVGVNNPSKLARTGNTQEECTTQVIFCCQCGAGPYGGDQGVCCGGSHSLHEFCPACPRQTY